MKAYDFLGEMAERSRERVRAARARESAAALYNRALATPPPPALSLDVFDVIAELKLRSPATGELRDVSFDRNVQITAYARGGACAVSVLTEPTEFHGRLADLQDAATALREFNVPAMRKDFLTDPYQLLEARAAGAGGALVIVTMLSDPSVTELLTCAQELGLFVLLEGFDVTDLERINRLTEHADPATVLAGVNCRDLRSLQVDFARFGTLAAVLSARLRCVAESGVASSEDVRTVAEQGYRLALVGSALMTSSEPEATLRELITTGRETVARQASA
jgi:indole-3-glycerol phosphate synthase